MIPDLFLYTERMIDMRIRVGVALVCAIGISSILMRYSSPSNGTLSQAQPMAPTVDVSQMAKDLQTGSLNAGSALVAAIQSIKLPSIEMPTLVHLSSPPEIPEPTPVEQVETPFEQPIPEEPPTSTPSYQPPEVPNEPIEPSIDVPSPKPPRTIPTSTPQPTKTPKPTKVPKPTEVTYPPINDDTRPGSNLNEIFQEVEKRACVPAALLMAIKTTETGERFKNDSAASIKIYNTYGWWKTGTGDPCYGYGYHTQTGIVPQDSVKAGSKCSSAVGNPTDIGIMGLHQISQWEQETTRKTTIKTLPKNIDRRVLFDSTLIFAIATKGRAGNSPQPSCSDWPQETVKLVAEKHHGVCKYDYGTGNAGDYCKKIWDLYQSYK